MRDMAYNYGTVEWWELEVSRPPTYVAEHLRFSNWESAIIAFKQTAKKDDPLFARVYAVQRKNRGRIVTWSYDRKPKDA